MKSYQIELFEDVNGRFMADASELGLAPGEFPEAIEIVSPRWRSTFLRKEIVIGPSGDADYAIYKLPVGVREIYIFND